MLADIARIRSQVLRRRRWQAAMTRVAAVLQWIGLLYAVPGMLLLGLLLLGMALPAVVILAVLLIMQLPCYLLCKVLVTSDESLELEKRAS